jgi:tRNA threonylcarbamoyladenosine biosynthesis protein TsaB
MRSLPALTEVPANILAISTAGPWCSVALSRRDAATLDVIEQQVGHAHASSALPMISALLESAGVGLAAVDGVAFDAGPGGFTGLRIACALAQGLAFGRGIRTLAVGSLAALAHTTLSEVGAGATTVVTAIDARMNECYVAVFAALPAGDDWRIEVIEPAQLCQLDNVAEWFATVAAGSPAERSLIVAGDVLARSDALSAAASNAGALVRPGQRPVARAVARMATSPAYLGDWLPAAQARPIYVRSKVALDVTEQRELRRRNAELRR